MVSTKRVNRGFDVFCLDLWPLTVSPPDPHEHFAYELRSQYLEKLTTLDSMILVTYQEEENSA
jgi:hypothetical protein